jgi:predicted DNA-binding transcriptional regulator AlpA
MEAIRLVVLVGVIFAVVAASMVMAARYRRELRRLRKIEKDAGTVASQQASLEEQVRSFAYSNHSYQEMFRNHDEITVQQAAKMAGMGTSIVYSRISDGTLPHRRVLREDTRRIVINEDRFLAWAASNGPARVLPMPREEWR